MVTEQIKIKCPCCGAILAIRIQPNIENRNLKCPVCRESSPFRLFKKIENFGRNDADDPTIYPEENVRSKSLETSYSGADENGLLGILIHGSGKSAMSFRLKIGKNIIGRKAPDSSADIQIPFPADCRRMSREHLMIEVKAVHGKGFVYYASLCKKKVNDTFVNKEKLEFGDCIVLKEGDVLSLPDAELTFEIPDEDSTIL